jgi:CPA2 family monovalent cation:H+ antiporter-2
MNNLQPLIADLALILACAGVMTLLFKWLKQPVVLGYIVAGFIASPNMPYMPSVTDLENIHLWSDLGVIFLLFSLGLEFSFRKILKMGAAPIIAACAIILGMMSVGTFTGGLFGWSQMDCIYLGGMLAMSSTTIIFKAFDDMGLRQKRFASLVLSVLIIEDILAIVLMVMLSTLAVSKEFEGTQMLESILKLAFFLVLWFVVGIYFVPQLLRKLKPLMTNETLTIVSLALCFGMVVFASAVGFSAAFGAFIMGSILAETVEAEKIEHLVTPVKDLFGAIFFVSVGMMVDVALIAEYIVPILCIVAAIMLGQAILSTGGFLLAGQPLKTAMQCSFSLTQIGEFAFILATLGTSLHVTSEFLYPIVVTVSVFTTFTTPYMIRLAEPAYGVVARTLPKQWQAKLAEYAADDDKSEGYASECFGADGANATLGGVAHHNYWSTYLKRTAIIVLIHSVLCIAVSALMLIYGKSYIADLMPAPWADIITAVLTILLCGPFLWTLMRYGSRNEDVMAIWNSGHVNRIKLLSVQLLRLAIGAAFISLILGYTIHWSGTPGIFIVLAILFAIVLSPRLQARSERMTQTFTENLTERERREKAENELVLGNIG